MAGMTMIEKIARAIYGEFPNMYDTKVRTTTSAAPYWTAVTKAETWEEAEDRHEACLKQARAAVEALMEPTHEMIAAFHEPRPAPTYSVATGSLQAMLNAALDDKALQPETTPWPRGSFPLTKDQQTHAVEWAESHPCPIDYTGTAGGKITYEFCPTSRGTVETVSCACGKSLNLTDYSKW